MPPDPIHRTLPGEALEQLQIAQARLSEAITAVSKAWVRLAEDRATGVDLVLELRGLAQHAERVEGQLQAVIEGKVGRKPAAANDELVVEREPGEGS